MQRVLVMNRFNIIFTAMIWIVGLQAPGMFAQQQQYVVYTLEPMSRLWLEGTATVGDYTCKAGLIDGVARLRVHSIQKSDSSSPDTGKSEVHLSIVVKNLECGNNAMNADMYDAMKADSFPLIQYELVESTILSDSNIVDSTRRVHTIGNLTIAGVKKSVQMVITIRKLSPVRFRITGSKTLSMRDYNITPPSAFLGLIKAHEKLIVRFDLVVQEEISGLREEQKNK